MLLLNLSAVCAAQPQRGKSTSPKMCQEPQKTLLQACSFSPRLGLKGSSSASQTLSALSQHENGGKNFKVERERERVGERESEREGGREGEVAWLRCTSPFRCVCSILCWMYTCARRQKRRSRCTLTDECLLAPQTAGLPSSVPAGLPTPYLRALPASRRTVGVHWLLRGTVRLYFCRLV